MSITTIRQACDDDYEPYVPPARAEFPAPPVPAPEPVPVKNTGISACVFVNESTQVGVVRRDKEVLMTFTCPKTFNSVQVWVAHSRVVELFTKTKVAYEDESVQR
jgi:hypothetical protein